MINRKHHFYGFIVLITISFSCGTFNKATTLDEKSGYFPAKSNKHVNVLKNVSINADTLKQLIIVPEEPYWIEMANNMKYFNKIMTFKELEKDIIEKGLTDKIPNLSDGIGLHKAFHHYGPFIVLNVTKVQKKGKGWFAGLTLYNPNKGDLIFQNEIWLNLMWDGWTDQGTMFPLFNSLLDYLSYQK